MIAVFTLGAIDVVLVAITTWRLFAWHRTLGGADRAIRAMLAKRGVEVTLDVLDDDRCAFTVDGESIELERSRVRLYGEVVAGKTILAVFRRERPVEDGPLRTAARVAIEGPVLLGVLEQAPPRAVERVEAWRVLAILATLAFGVIVATEVRVALAILGAIALAFGSDLFTENFIGTILLVGKRAPDGPDADRRKIIAGLGAAVAIIGALAIPGRLPLETSWATRHAPRAPIDHVDPALDGQLVVLTGELDSAERVGDELLAPGDALVIERDVEVGTWGHYPTGKIATWRYSWSPGTIDQLASKTSRVATATIGPYRIALAGAKLFALPKLTPTAATASPSLAWDEEEHQFRTKDPQAVGLHADLARIEYTGLLAGTEVTIYGRQQGDRIVAIDDAHPISILEKAPQQGETVFDAWPDDPVTAIFLVIGFLGALLIWLRPTHVLVGLAVAGAIALYALARGDLDTAMMLLVVPFGLVLVNMPLSLPPAMGGILLLAAPIAIMRATESEPLAQLGGVIVVALLVFMRHGFGWHRSVGWD